VNNDRTLFSKLAVEFEAWILYILSQASISGVDKQLMEKFQMAFAVAAFRCRYPFCHNFSNGFATAELRREHEASHFIRIYCLTTSCPWNRIGFKDGIALRNHRRTHHKEIESLASAKGRLLSDDAHLDSIREQNRSRLEDLRPPIFSYDRNKNAASLAERYLDKVSPIYVRQGEDWFAFFEPRHPRILDIEAVHTLPHYSMVTTAKFSFCGLYFATASEARITLFNVTTAAKLKDWIIDKVHNGDNHIRDICFHPDSTKVISAGQGKSVCVRDRSLNKIYRQH
jgi:WD40 repeat protein